MLWNNPAQADYVAPVIGTSSYIAVASVPHFSIGLCSSQQMQVVKSVIIIESSAALTFGEEVKQMSTVIVSEGVFQCFFIFFLRKEIFDGAFNALWVNCTSRVVLQSSFHHCACFIYPGTMSCQESTIPCSFCLLAGRWEFLFRLDAVEHTHTQTHTQTHAHLIGLLWLFIGFLGSSYSQ